MRPTFLNDIFTDVNMIKKKNVDTTISILASSSKQLSLFTNIQKKQKTESVYLTIRLSIKSVRAS